MEFSNSLNGLWTLVDRFKDRSALQAIFVATVVFIWFACIALKKVRKSELGDLPYVGTKQEFRTNCKSLLRRGWELYGDGWWKLDTPDGDRVVMPHKYINELKNRPRKDLSFTKANSDILLGKYTGIDEVNEQSIEVVRLDLTKNISILLPAIEEETAYAFSQEFPGSSDWTSVALHSKVLRIVSMVSSRIFVGAEVSRKEEWIQASIHYTSDIRRLEKMKAMPRELLFPVLSQRAKEKAAQGDRYDAPKDTIEWMQERSAHIPTFDFREQAHIQLIIGLAAIHTTGMATTHMMYDLAARPEYIEPLREEIQRVLEEEGGLTKPALTKLRLMDSFMKESQRLSPIALTFFTRKTSSPITLSDGFHVPSGTHLTCNEQIPNPDPDVWGRLDEFDGFRFARAVEGGADGSAKLNFDTTSEQSMGFGHGRHACPGRYFATAEIKLILCHLLLNYEIKFPDQINGRPDNSLFEIAIMPDMTQTVLVRKRSFTDSKART